MIIRGSIKTPGDLLHFPQIERIESVYLWHAVKKVAVGEQHPAVAEEHRERIGIGQSSKRLVHGR